MTFTLATTLDEALQALDSGATPIAGGTDLVVRSRTGNVPLPDDLVAIDRIPELGTVQTDGGGLRIGATVSHATVASHPDILRRFASLADASTLVGSPATRHVGTIGGNVMNASPAMDTGAPLVVLGARVVLASTSGTREVAVGDLWSGPGTTTAGSDELCTAVLVPLQPARSASAYVRLEYRRAMEIAVVGAAARVELDDDGTVASLDVALTAVAPTILSVTGISVSGSPVDDAAASAQQAAMAQAVPISDLRASDEYRRHMVGIMAKRAVEAAATRAAGTEVSVPVNRAHGIGAPA